MSKAFSNQVPTSGDIASHLDGMNIHEMGNGYCLATSRYRATSHYLSNKKLFLEWIEVEEF